MAAIANESSPNLQTSAHAVNWIALGPDNLCATSWLARPADNGDRLVIQASRSGVGHTVDTQPTAVLSRVKARRFATSEAAPSAALTRLPRGASRAIVDGVP